MRMLLPRWKEVVVAVSLLCLGIITFVLAWPQTSRRYRSVTAATLFRCKAQSEDDPYGRIMRREYRSVLDPVTMVTKGITLNQQRSFIGMFSLQHTDVENVEAFGTNEGTEIKGFPAVRSSGQVSEERDAFIPVHYWLDQLSISREDVVPIPPTLSPLLGLVISIAGIVLILLGAKRVYIICTR